MISKGKEMADKVEYMSRKALKNYSCDGNKKNAYGVCWYEYLLDTLELSFKAKTVDGDRNIYRIIATDRLGAVSGFLSKKAEEEFHQSISNYKSKCIRRIIGYTFKYGQMFCLEERSDLKKFSCDLESVIDGGYYCIDAKIGNRDEARIDGILKSVDVDNVLNHITPELFKNVYVESHLRDVAVFELTNLEIEGALWD